MSLKRVLLVALATIVTLTVGVLLFAFNTDLGRFEPRIEQFLSQTLNRETRFNDLSLELGWPTRVAFEGLTIANAPWVEDDQALLGIGTLNAEIDFWSLVDDQPILIERFRAADITIHLAWSPEGESNFKFGKPGQEKAQPDGPIRRGAPLVLRDAELTNALIQLDLASKTNLLAVDLLGLDLETDDTLAVELQGDVNEQPMSFSGNIGPFEELVAAGAVTIQGAGKIADLSLDGQLELDSLTHPNRPQISLDLEGENILHVERFLGIPTSKEGPYELKALTNEDGEDWVLNVEGKVHDSTLQAETRLAGIQDLSRASVDLHARGGDLNLVLALFGLDEAPSEPFEIIGKIERDNRRFSIEDVSLIIGPTALDFSGAMNNFPDFQHSTLKLNVAGPDIARFRGLLGLPGAAEGPFQIAATVSPDDTGAELASLVLENALGKLTASGQLTRANNFQGSAFKVSVSSDNTRNTLEILKLPGLAAVPLSLDADLAIEEEGVRLSNARLSGLYATTLQAEGHISWDPLGGNTDLDLQFEGSDLAATLEPLGVSLPLNLGAYEIETSLRPTRAGLRLGGLQANIGENTLKLDGLVPLKSSLDGLDLTVEAEGPDLGNLIPAQEDFVFPSVPWSVNSHIRRVDQRLRLDNTRLKVAKTSAEGSANGAWPLDNQQWNLQLSADGPDISQFVSRIDDFEPGPVPFKLELTAALDGDSLELQPAILELGAARLEVSGLANDLLDVSSADMSIALDIPDLSAIGVWAGEPLPATSAGITTTLSGRNSRLSFNPLEVRTGESVGHGRISLDLSEEVPRLDIELHSDSLDFTELLPGAGVKDPGAAPASDSAFVFNDEPLPFELLEQINGSVNMDIARFVTTDRIVYDIIMEVDIENGELDLTRYRSRGITGDLELSGSMASVGNGQGAINFTLDARDLMPAREDWQQADPTTLPSINALLEMESTGGSLRELASGLSGNIRAVASEGVLPGRGLGALNTLLLDQILSIIIPGTGSQSPTTLVCFAGQVNIEDGMAVTTPIVALRTEKLLVLASGRVNLKDESLKLSFETTPTKLLGASLTELVNPFVSVEGTLKQPSPTIDATGTLIYGGAAAATAGLSILAKGVWDRLKKATNPCETLRADLVAAAAQDP